MQLVPCWGGHWLTPSPQVLSPPLQPFARPILWHLPSQRSANARRGFLQTWVSSGSLGERGLPERSDSHSWLCPRRCCPGDLSCCDAADGELPFQLAEHPLLGWERRGRDLRSQAGDSACAQVPTALLVPAFWERLVGPAFPRALRGRLWKAVKQERDLGVTSQKQTLPNLWRLIRAASTGPAFSAAVAPAPSRLLRA